MMIQMFRSFLFFLFLVICFGNAHAQTQDLPQFIFPLDCKLGKDCVIVNYFDMDPSPKHMDYECNSKTYNAHRGVDFAIPNYRDMLNGVDVIAALEGDVKRVRDGEDDKPKDKPGYDAVKKSGRECGNGILIEHQNGWQSFYCHLKQGSLRVKPGDHVKEGQVIAQVGQSGWSEFPHLHFSALKNDLYVDPFTGLTEGSGCGKLQQSLWRSPMAYSPFALFDAGFSADMPDFKHLYAGKIPVVDEISVDAQSLVYWFGLYQSSQGDQVRMQILDPYGDLYHERRFTIDRSKKRAHFYYAGKKTCNAALMIGDYSGITMITRRDAGGSIIYQQSYEHVIHVK